MGIAAEEDMAVLMNLNHNGQAFTLSKKLNDKGVTDGASLNKLIKSEKAEYTFARPSRPARTRCGSILARGARHPPVPGREGIVVPPPQMVANMRVGAMDGFCVGEPWNNRAIMDKIGFTANTTQDL